MDFSNMEGWPIRNHKVNLSQPGNIPTIIFIYISRPFLVFMSLCCETIWKDYYVLSYIARWMFGGRIQIAGNISLCVYVGWQNGHI